VADPARPGGGVVMSHSNPGQHTSIAILLGNVDVTDRTHRLDIVSGLAGRGVKSMKDLSRDEAASIITHLRQLRDIDELRLLAEQYRPAVTP
jgi:hypothetical protein